MDVQTIMQAIATVGFPIVWCCGLGWYVKYTTDKYRDDIVHMAELHKSEMDEMKTAITNNTIALQKLCEKLGD